jgi:metallophosphoesterase superfamily enzyme
MSLADTIRNGITPAWPVVTPGKRYTVPKLNIQEPKAGVYEKAVILPDMQIGYFHQANGTLEAIHDEDAITCALAIVKAAKPSQVVLVGDNLDLCEFGKYRYTPAFARTTQAAIDRATTKNDLAT